MTEWFSDRLREEKIVQQFKEQFSAVEINQEGKEVTKMVSDAQVAFFNKLLDEKEFGAGQDKDALRTQFATLNSASGSKWIETAIGLPKRDDSNDPVVAPPFGS